MLKAFLLAICVAYVWAEESTDTNEHVKRQVLGYPGFGAYPYAGYGLGGVGGFYGGYPGMLYGRKRREAETETETEQRPMKRQVLGYPGFGAYPYAGYGLGGVGGFYGGYPGMLYGRKRREAETETEQWPREKRYLGGFYGGYPGFGYAPVYGGLGYPGYGAAVLGRKRREAETNEETAADTTETQDKRSLFGGYGGFGSGFGGGFGGYRPGFGYGYGGFRPGFGGYGNNFFPGYGFGGYSDYPGWGSGYYSRWRRDAETEKQEDKDKRHVLLGGYPGYMGGVYPGFGYGGFGYGAGYGYGAPFLL